MFPGPHYYYRYSVRTMKIGTTYGKVYAKVPRVLIPELRNSKVSEEEITKTSAISLYDIDQMIYHNNLATYATFSTGGQMLCYSV